MKNKIALTLTFLLITVTSNVFSFEQEDEYNVELENRTTRVTLRRALEPGVTYQLSIKPQPADVYSDITDKVGYYYDVNLSSKLILSRFLGAGEIPDFDPYSPPLELYNKSFKKQDSFGIFEIEDEIINNIFDRETHQFKMTKVELKIKFEVQLIGRKIIVKMISVEQK